MKAGVVKWVMLVLVLCIGTTALAQKKYTISGYLRDGQTGEELIGASVYVDELKAGTTSNVYGFYSLTLPEGTYNIIYTFLGMAPISQEVELNKNVKLEQLGLNN